MARRSDEWGLPLCVKVQSLLAHLVIAIKKAMVCIPVRHSKFPRFPMQIGSRSPAAKDQGGTGSQLFKCARVHCRENDACRKMRDDYATTMNGKQRMERMEMQ